MMKHTIEKLRIMIEKDQKIKADNQKEKEAQER